MAQNGPKQNLKPRAAKSASTLAGLWAHHHGEWRDTAQIASQWNDAAELDPKLLRYEVQGQWWATLANLGITLVVSREYEHLLMAMTVQNGDPHLSFMKLPHPSGLAVDADKGHLYVASTRNPNQVFELAAVHGHLDRLDMPYEGPEDNPLVPVCSHYYPGCYYMHDLAFIGGALFANSVGQNAVVRLAENGRGERVWWPKCIETDDGPVFGQNHIQLNSIAAGAHIEHSFFSASADKISARRPGHRNFPVDKRGVIFSGQTREPIVHGLTRPHSARLHQDKLWVDNSGYGELCLVENGQLTIVARLPGWTRGLGFWGDIAFVGTSRVIPRFRQYAPGLEVENSLCGLHAVNIQSGDILGSIIWPYGNQIFAVEPLGHQITSGFPFPVGAKRATRREKLLFYSYTLDQKGNEA
ncbi:MAG: DUF4915 domain-containing protein [Chloroflexi bacterium]|nr:DUF4915 domain-containing protein [Chloroflexota bacterium]